MSNSSSNIVWSLLQLKGKSKYYATILCFNCLNVNRPRRDFSQICEILGIFVEEITSLKQSMSELKQKQPILVSLLFSTEENSTSRAYIIPDFQFAISAAVSILQAVAFGMVFSSYLLCLLIGRCSNFFSGWVK